MLSKLLNGLYKIVQMRLPIMIVSQNQMFSENTLRNIKIQKRRKNTFCPIRLNSVK